jgi:hypothetical protein
VVGKAAGPVLSVEEIPMDQKDEVKSRFQIEQLEERIAPSANLNPGENNTTHQGTQPPDGTSGNTSNNSN